MKVKQSTAPTVGVAAPVTTTAPATAPTPAPTIAYTAVDPTFTQNPTDGLQVTYAVSASATETNSSGQTINLGAAGELPAGVLNFYNQGILMCSLNVGGSTTSGPCTITYPNFGTYSVVTEYLPSGATPVTETDQETISPLDQAAATTLSFTSASPFSGFVPGYGAPGVGFYESGYNIDLAATSSNPESPEYVETLADLTTGRSVTLPASTNCCQATVITSQSTDPDGTGTQLMPSGDVSVTGLGNVADTDVIDVSVNTTATLDYMASPDSASVQIWPLPS